MAKARKRRPGGGRKPAGPVAKTSNFSTRITAETRAALEAEAAATGFSISQAAERALKLGLAELQDRRTSQSVPTVGATHSLRVLVGQLADDCSVTPGDKRFEWNEDAFIFEAFAGALAMLLEELRPTESALQAYLANTPDIHQAWRETLATPHALASHIFLGLWEDLHSIEPKSFSAAKSFLTSLSNSITTMPANFIGDTEAAAWSRYSYALSDARRNLKIGEKKS